MNYKVDREVLMFTLFFICFFFNLPMRPLLLLLMKLRTIKKFLSKHCLSQNDLKVYKFYVMTLI